METRARHLNYDINMISFDTYTVKSAEI